VQLVVRDRSMVHIGEKRTDGVMFNRKIVNHRGTWRPLLPLLRRFRNRCASPSEKGDGASLGPIDTDYIRSHGCFSDHTVCCG
jgi:hypothetical protein